MAGQAGAGNGLVLAYQVEDNSTINITGSVASGDAKIIEVDLAHNGVRGLVRDSNYISDMGLSRRKWTD
jgi:hypothetical protein